MRASLRMFAGNEGSEVFAPIGLISRCYDMDNDLLTAKQLAERLRVKPRTVKDWEHAGLIPAIRLTPKVIRYDLEQVVSALKRRQEATRCSDEK